MPTRLPASSTAAHSSKSCTFDILVRNRSKSGGRRAAAGHNRPCRAARIDKIGTTRGATSCCCTFHPTNESHGGGSSVGSDPAIAEPTHRLPPTPLEVLPGECVARASGRRTPVPLATAGATRGDVRGSKERGRDRVPWAGCGLARRGLVEASRFWSILISFARRRPAAQNTALTGAKARTGPTIASCAASPKHSIARPSGRKSRSSHARRAHDSTRIRRHERGRPTRCRCRRGVLPRVASSHARAQGGGASRVRSAAPRV